MLAGYLCSDETFGYGGLRFTKAQDENLNDVLIGFQTTRALAWPQVFCSLQAAGIPLKLDKSQTGKIAIVCESRGSIDDLSVRIVNVLASSASRARSKYRFFEDKGWLLPTQDTTGIEHEARASNARQVKVFGLKLPRTPMRISLALLAIAILASIFFSNLPLSFEPENKLSSPMGQLAETAPEGFSKIAKSSAVAEIATSQLDPEAVSNIAMQASENSQELAQIKVKILKVIERLGVSAEITKSVNFGGVTQLVLELSQTGQSFAFQLEKSSDAYTVVKCRELK
ncbi:MAG: hypothetical protein RL196_1030 [Actinomycetota bacterium]